MLRKRVDIVVVHYVPTDGHEQRLSAASLKVGPRTKEPHPSGACACAGGGAAHGSRQSCATNRGKTPGRHHSLTGRPNANDALWRCRRLKSDADRDRPGARGQRPAATTEEAESL